MFNWFDLMRQVQANPSFDAMAQQFQLSGDQQQKAVAAFMPAFLLGLQHAMTSANSAQFLQSLMSGGYQNFWQAPGQFFTPQAQQQGRLLLDQLFGSDDVSRRVAHQAADYAGIGVETMRQVLPLLAGLLAGGMAQWMVAQSQAAQGFAAQDKNEQSKQVPANPWADIWATWMKPMQPEAKPTANPFQEMMASFVQATPPPKPPEPAPQSSSSWEGMMEQGREMQMQYLASLQSIFEDAWKADSGKS